MLTTTQNMGHRSLLVDVRTNFVVTAFIGFFMYPQGGTTYKCMLDTTLLYKYFLQFTLF